MSGPFNVTQTSGADVLPIVERLKTAIDGESFTNANTALLYTIFDISYPEISDKDLIKGVRQASEHICLLLDSFENPIDTQDKTKLN